MLLLGRLDPVGVKVSLMAAAVDMNFNLAELHCLRSHPFPLNGGTVSSSPRLLSKTCYFSGYTDLITIVQFFVLQSVAL